MASEKPHSNHREELNDMAFCPCPSSRVIYLFTISVALVYDVAHRPTAAAFSRLPTIESSSNTSTVGVGVTTMNIW